VLEHITRRLRQFVRGERTGVAATITPQHLLLNRNALLPAASPDHYCLPVLKTESRSEAVLTPPQRRSRFFLGTDARASRSRRRRRWLRGMFSGTRPF